MEPKDLIPKYDPRIHDIVEVIGFLPGDLVTITIRAHSLGSVFICKAVSTDPEISVKKSEQ